MTAVERLRQLTSQMHLEPAEECSSSRHPPEHQDAIAVSSAALPGGRKIQLLKTLLSSYCENNCRYCPFSSDLDTPRTAFTPDDFARLFFQLYRSGLVEGIFLSSGIFQGARITQEKLNDTAVILRKKYHYQGYLHLKIMPGAEKNQVYQAMLYADRLSVNLEAPHPGALRSLAPKKHFYQDLIKPLKWIHENRRKPAEPETFQGRWPSSTTQFVVGAAGENDLELLSTTARLQRTAGISRAYFSSFQPLAGTPLEEHPPSSPTREHRLYQASFLLQDYGFVLEDLPFDNQGYLPLDRNPKQAWAEQNLNCDPLEINSAPYHTLLKIPGIGPRRARLICHHRQTAPFKAVEDLKQIRAFSPQSLPFILLDGKRPPQQLKMF